MSDSPNSFERCRRIARRWWGIELVLTDADGTIPEHAAAGPMVGTLPVVPSPANDVCRLALQSKEGLHRCGASIARAFMKAADDNGLSSHECHLGFTLVAATVPNGGSGGESGGGCVVACGAREEASGPLDKPRTRERLLELRRNVPKASPGEVPLLPLDELERMAELTQLAAELVSAPTQAEGPARPRRGHRRAPPLVFGRSLAMIEVQQLLERIVESDATVLVHGESGTGKELVAQHIHDRGSRRERPFVGQNCSALNDNLLESALFGHIRGAFTGATRDHRGLFETADGGTLLLDEIGDMSPALQVKLLRVLQEGTFTPVGSDQERHVDVRIIASSHRELGGLVQVGRFREDLYYRVNVLRVDVPPLREREDDLKILAEHFLSQHPGPRGPRRLARETWSLLQRHQWPGNVRELQNEIERMSVLAGEDEDVLSPGLVSRRIVESIERGPTAADAFTGRDLPKLRDAVEALERGLLEESLRRNKGNKSGVARELGMARSNLFLKLDKYGLRGR